MQKHSLVSNIMCYSCVSSKIGQ